jgi:orotate phosphoribosyltransferase
MPAKKAGEWYHWMFYLRRGLFNHMFLSAVSQMFIYKMERIDPYLDFQISGLETAATPMLAGIPLIARVYDDDINAFVVRQKPKEYGLLNTIEGMPNTKPVVMLDDLCNSSASLSKCYKELVNLNMEVCPTAFVLVNKSYKITDSNKRLNSDMYLPSHIKVISLFTLDDFELIGNSH